MHSIIYLANEGKIHQKQKWFNSIYASKRHVDEYHIYDMLSSHCTLGIISAAFTHTHLRCVHACVEYILELVEIAIEWVLCRILQNWIIIQFELRLYISNKILPDAMHRTINSLKMFFFF